MNELKAYAEAPTAASSVPPPPAELRQVDRLAMIGRLAAAILRELVEQLGDVSRRAESLADGKLGAAETREGARSIVEQTEQMGAKARCLLSFAQPRTFEREVVDIGTLVHSTIALIAPMALLRGVVVTVNPTSEKVTAELDPKQIEQAVVTLLESAIHACRLGGNVRVTVSEGRDAALDLIHIDVADDGTPFRTEDRLRLFEPFQNVTPGHEDAGLGLCVAESIVSDHGGWIEVGCANEGDRFHIRLPKRTTAA